ncbi:MAG: pyridoxamine 5'-phosphate oxidase family protein [Firmicutes bacterium]|nr:pyridoxamine 5'-phosphate oxidase family protein [Bacillota bacterium]NBI62040.1 pyridoxamine 5'-phosphate oxidase family protein [Clostridiales bacterium]
MRRRDREIREFNEILEIMKRCRVCHVAFHSNDEYPYVVPMNFGVSEENGQVTLCFHGADRGRKHDLLRENDKVSFVMEDAHEIVTGPRVGACECTMEFECVMGTGEMDYVAEEEKEAALRTLLEQYGVEEGKADYHFHHEVVPKVAVLRLRVNHLTAKRRKVGLP